MAAPANCSCPGKKQRGRRKEKKCRACVEAATAANRSDIKSAATSVSDGVVSDDAVLHVETLKCAIESSGGVEVTPLVLAADLPQLHVSNERSSQAANDASGAATPPQFKDTPPSTPPTKRRDMCLSVEDEIEFEDPENAARHLAAVEATSAWRDSERSDLDSMSTQDLTSCEVSEEEWDMISDFRSLRTGISPAPLRGRGRHTTGAGCPSAAARSAPRTSGKPRGNSSSSKAPEPAKTVRPIRGTPSVGEGARATPELLVHLDESFHQEVFVPVDMTLGAFAKWADHKVDALKSKGLPSKAKNATISAVSRFLGKY
eukprot:CAMPEP_0114556602 /NCGR_PEP_ID=MMETSP0114-20121206/9377_1 /TAXON_ID=31324 /ORGANISM="Goniomonas sp, Strain m" /LENGTH=316 /DNA_ID=CAMNT_0001741819 /DNA_START=58 /DNA_END=1008 /DNA_ORIENTATION=-